MAWHRWRKARASRFNMPGAAACSSALTTSFGSLSHHQRYRLAIAILSKASHHNVLYCATAKPLTLQDQMPLMPSRNPLCSVVQWGFGHGSTGSLQLAVRCTPPMHASVRCCSCARACVDGRDTCPECLQGAGACGRCARCHTHVASQDRGQIHATWAASKHTRRTAELY